MTRASLPSGTAMELVRPSEPARLVARLIQVGLLVVGLVLGFTPWQQSSPGDGRVVAFAPEDRRQSVDAPIEGRVLRWYVREGSVVKKGDPIVDLSDNDPDIMLRLRAERDAVAARIEAARMRATSIESRIDSLDEARRSAVTAADARIRMATQRVTAAEQAVELAIATLETARANTERQRSLFDKGLASKRLLELTELEETRAQTEVERSRVALEAARSEEAAIGADRAKVDGDAGASINDARATRSSAEAEVASAAAELARIESRLARQSTQSVAAPRDGIVFRIVANGQAGEIVKAGDPLAVIVPETEDRAVELSISGNDMPLVHEGDAVRLHFEGWPALQFTGWPSVALGTFPGRVALVDSTDDGKGNFRVLVVPEPGQPWPSARYLRQGVRVHGWVQLGKVRLGYELWRQFNGFPPSLPGDPAETKGVPSTEGAK